MRFSILIGFSGLLKGLGARFRRTSKGIEMVSAFSRRFGVDWALLMASGGSRTVTGGVLKPSEEVPTLAEGFEWFQGI